MNLKSFISAISVTSILFAAPALAGQKIEGELVITAGGGLMGNMLEEYFYKPFQKATGVSVLRYDIEIQDQWARVEAMARSGKTEFDIVTATGPDLVDKADILYEIDCSKLTAIMKNGVEGACTPYGVARTTGGMLIAYNDEAFSKEKPQNWADFWDTERFPGPRGLPDTGDRDWWVPLAALMADGVAKDQLFPMDLDRAYKKLDEIRPNIAVWWKSGDNVQQIMREHEVVMTMSYSGRALQAIEDGAPFAMSWDQAIRDTGYMSIIKGSPNPDAALAYLDFFYSNPDNHGPFMEAINYATSNKEAMELLAPEERKLYATAADNYGKLVSPDFKWIGENRAELRERWLNWITR